MNRSYSFDFGPDGTCRPEVLIGSRVDSEPKDSGLKQVNQLIEELRGIIAPSFTNIAVEGELCNWKVSSAGHCYFNLKDSSPEMHRQPPQISCVFFSGSTFNLNFTPANGDKVQIKGSMEIYKLQGQLQLVVRSLTKDGSGMNHERLLRLKRQLQNEGLFAENHKLRLPKYPRVIGVVTSPTGAVIHDIRTTLAEINPSVRILLSPAAVQGDSAEQELICALKKLEAVEEVDCIIIGRGGGSEENLMAFNSEGLVRAIYACTKPTISAVGHESDYSLCDLVADLRAPTPTGAAQMAVLSKKALLQELNSFITQAAISLKRNIDIRRRELLGISTRPCLKNPLYGINDKRQWLDKLQNNIDTYCHNAFIKKQSQLREIKSSTAIRLPKSLLARFKNDLSVCKNQLNALAPDKVLERGYAIISDNDKNVIQSSKNIEPGLNVNIQFKDGTVKAVTQ